MSAPDRGADGPITEIALWALAFGFAGFVSQSAFFLLPFALTMALLAALRLRGETFVILSFSWLVVLLAGTLAAALVGLVYAAALEP